MRGRKLSRISIFFGQDQIDRLRELSDESGAPVAELARRALDAYLASRTVAHRRGTGSWEPTTTRPEGQGVSGGRTERHVAAVDLAEGVVAHGAGTA